MLSTDEFAEWSKKVVLFLHNTSHCKDEKYDDLLFEKGGNGFPTMSYLGADGRLLTQVGHITPVAQLEEAFQKIADWRALQKAVREGADDRRKELFMLEVRNGYCTYAEATKALAVAREAGHAIEMDGAEKRKLDRALVNLEFRDILASTKRTEMAKGGKACYAMFKAGRIPTSSQITSFWQYMFEYAKAEKNAARYEEILDKCRELMGEDRRFRRYIGRLERELEQLKKSDG